MYWTDKDGQQILISSMTDLYLMNTLKMLSNFGKTKRARVYKELLSEAKRRGLYIADLKSPRSNSGVSNRASTFFSNWADECSRESGGYGCGYESSYESGYGWGEY